MPDSENILTQFTSRVSSATVRGESLQNSIGETAENCGAFGCLRGTDRALMLELRCKCGNLTAFSYAFLERIDFDASSGLTLHFAGQKVVIHGRNLNSELRRSLRLIDLLVRHRVAWIQEADEPTALAAEGNATVVERIAFE